jgi:hypothetical protein
MKRLKHQPNSKNTKKGVQQLQPSLLPLAGTGEGLWFKNAIEIQRIEWNR